MAFLKAISAPGPKFFKKTIDFSDEVCYNCIIKKRKEFKKMKCEFWMSGEFMVCNQGEDVATFKVLDEAVDYVQENWVEGNGDEVDVIDATTGEILLHFTDDVDFQDDEPDFDLELGFNPYIGDYDWDC